MAANPLESRSSFTFTTHLSPIKTTVRCWGLLIADDASILEDEVQSRIPRTKFIEIDLCGVTYIDGTGASTITALYYEAKANGCHLEWKCRDNLVRWKLQAARLWSVFREYGQHL
jgi:anti-anti-sigma regulatory factor